MMTNYDIYFREEFYDIPADKKWDVFISAFNLSARVNKVYDDITADLKYWFIFPEYDFSTEDIPEDPNNVILPSGAESKQLMHADKIIDFKSMVDLDVCIDITGFMRPQLLFFMQQLKHSGFTNFDVIYSEPARYSRGSSTKFSNGSVYETRPIHGYYGVNNIGRGRDLTIIAAGYDKSLISRVAQYSENSEIVQLIGFPSLRPDMYQENMMQVVSSSDSLSELPKDNIIFSPAADPFETASVISRYIKETNSLDKYDNIYISPLSTKPQSLGVGLMHLLEFSETNVSVIYPYTTGYSKETSEGISKIWLYHIEY